MTDYIQSYAQYVKYNLTGTPSPACANLHNLYSDITDSNSYSRSFKELQTQQAVYFVCKESYIGLIF